MRSHEPKIRRGTAERRARRILTDRLGWLRGFPSGVTADGAVRWITVPELGTRGEPDELEVDRDRLRRAEFGRTKLVREFPRALPRIVGDREAWAERVDRRLAWLKATVHGGDPLPESADLLAGHACRRAGERLAARSARAAELVAALAWVSETDLRRNLAAAERHDLDRVRSFAEPRALLLVRLVELLREHGQAVVPIAARLGRDDAVATVAPEGRAWSSVVRRVIKHGGATEFPRPEIVNDHVLCEWLVRCLPQHEGADRRALLRLVVAVLPREIEARWRTWWQRMQRLTSRAANVRPARSRKLRAGQLRGALREIEKLERDRPPSWSARQLTAMLDWRDASGSVNRENVALVVRALRAFPELYRGLSVRAGFLVHWNGYSQGRVGLREVVRATEDYWKEHARRRNALLPWEAALRGDPSFAPESSALPVRTAFRVVDRAAREGQVEHLPRLYWIQAVTKDLDATMRLSGAIDPELADRQSDMSAFRNRASVRLCGGDPERFRALVRALSEATWSYEADEQLESLARHRDLRTVLADGILDPQLAPLVRQLLELRSVLAATRSSKELRLARRRCAWIKRYPPELHGPLEELARATQDAERVAAEILGSAFPDPSRLERELGALAARIDAATGARQSGMRRRMRALERRLAAPAPAVSTRRLERLAGKVQTRATRACLERLVVDGAETLRRTLARGMQRDPPDDWLREPDKLAVVRGVLALGVPFRRLAFRLLRERLGEPPWDLRDHPANAAFLARMAERDILMAPWIDGTVRLRRRGAVLALADDPWDVLMMGAHFKTCLSPWEFNFFSAVANAADINKRVLYALDETGRVLGRCLLALTDAGEILTFHAYAHRPELELPRRVVEYAETLAERMETRVGTSGDVSSLVARDWYDDGAVDHTGRGSPFDFDLSGVPDDGLLDELRGRLNTPEPSAGAIQMMLWRVRNAGRPLLARSLLPVVERLGRCPTELLIEAIRMGREAGDEVATERLLDRAVRRWRSLDEWDGELLAAQMVASGRFSEALRLLRASRATGVRSWEEEDDEDRLLLAARAHEALHRPAIARRLYVHLAKLNSRYRKEVARIDELRGP